MMLQCFLSPVLPLTRIQTRKTCCAHKRAQSLRLRRTAIRMSGVNGGIDYSIDLTNIPDNLAKRIAYVQQGPDSPTALIEAAEEIAASTSQFPQTLPVLVDMLGYNNPVAANIAVNALAEAGDDAIPSLLAGVAAFNYSVNAYALRALGRIGNESVKEVCLACARRGPIPNVRRAACRALAGLHYSDANEAYECLVQLVEEEPDWGVRYAAVVALENFVAEQSASPQLLKRGLHALKSAAGIGDEEEGDKDATVKARSYVAYEAMMN